MSITLTPEQETRLNKSAAQLGKPADALLREWINSLPDIGEEKPATNREIHAQMLAEGLLGEYGDRTKTAQELALELRTETWRRSSEDA